MAKILVIHGPNLNMLGERETEIYGNLSLKDINDTLFHLAGTHTQLECFQSNAEHEIIDKIQESKKNNVDVILINPGAFGHTSIALRDAFLATKLPFYEIHLSNVYARESFRHTSYLSDIALGVISGLGSQSYYAAFNAAIEKFS